MAGVGDVARLAGVSAGIVSRVLNEDETLRVRDETRRKVIEAARKLQYTPNHAARALRKSRVGILGLAVHDASNPVYKSIVQGAQDEAMRAGYVLVLADVDALATNEKVFRQVISSGALDGLLLQRAGTVSDVFVARVASERLPMVLMNESSNGEEGSVATDDFAAAHLAGTHLVELGHTRIGLLRLSGDHVRSSVRMAGWSASLRDADISPDLNLVREGGQTIEDGYSGMTELLSNAPDVTAVLVSNVV